MDFPNRLSVAETRFLPTVLKARGAAGVAGPLSARIALRRAFQVLLAVVITALLWSHRAVADPFLPDNHDRVLLTIPAGADNKQLSRIRHLRERLQSDPSNAQVAAELARAYIQRGRTDADPRSLGHAQAALAHWWHRHDARVEILVLRATIRQSRHEFTEALQDLKLALARDPEHIQAWLTKATIHQVLGEYDEARQACLPLVPGAPPLVAATCAASTASLNGEAERSYRFLSHALKIYDTRDPDLKRWSLTVLAEIADRLNQTQRAEDHFRQALRLEPADAYLKGAYADFLLDQGRPNEVVRLLHDDTENNELLLRLALAERAVDPQHPALKKHIDSLHRRFRAAQDSGRGRHFRSEARFTLFLLHNPPKALHLALRNWSEQREPWDARLVLVTAIACDDPSAAEPVRQWIRERELEDYRFKKLIELHP